ncbi:hypothetical protein Zmor_014344 [Zophobas morio]|uniref:Uncharacterized protein n=1 Tax=Zophobas morio TaxID=2755281 RepID=A0AA38MG30_9CUCU|nr:hypothetical protein Zmor_014344 [Zophobas morio]
MCSRGPYGDNKGNSSGTVDTIFVVLSTAETMKTLFEDDFLDEMRILPVFRKEEFQCGDHLPKCTRSTAAKHIMFYEAESMHVDYEEIYQRFLKYRTKLKPAYWNFVHSKEVPGHWKRRRGSERGPP